MDKHDGGQAGATYDVVVYHEIDGGGEFAARGLSRDEATTYLGLLKSGAVKSPVPTRRAIVCRAGTCHKAYPEVVARLSW